jgi:hypothetical protein
MKTPISNPNDPSPRRRGKRAADQERALEVARAAKRMRRDLSSLKSLAAEVDAEEVRIGCPHTLLPLTDCP